jgi:hypothetical protein
MAPPMMGLLFLKKYSYQFMEPTGYPMSVPKAIQAIGLPTQNPLFRV